MGVPRCLWLVLLHILPALLLAAPPVRRWTDARYPPRFTHITRIHGLSRNSIYALLQDRRGFMWIGTEDGLNRYDGRTFKVYRHDPNDPDSLSSSWVTSLLEDPEGHIWVGTDGGGLNRIDRQTGGITRFKSDETADTLSSDGVSTLAQDVHGNLWIGTAGSGLNLLPADRKAGKPRFYYFGSGGHLGKHELGDTVSTMVFDSKGQLWVGTAEGVLSVGAPTPDPRNVRFKAVVPLTGAKPKGPINALCMDPNGYLWIGCASGLYRLDPVSLRCRNVSLGQDKLHVRRLYCDRFGVVWVGSEGHGMEKVVTGAAFDAPEQTWHLHHRADDPSSISSNDVECIYEDRSGILWVGTYADGLNKLSLGHRDPLAREKPPMHLYVPGHPSMRDRGASVVGAFLEDRQGNLWIGTDGQGLDLVRPPAHPNQELRFEHIVAGMGGLQENLVISMMEDSRGRIWAGTYTQGLAQVTLGPSGNPTFRHFKGKKGQPRSLQSNFIVSMMEDSKGRMWVGTVDEGLHRFFPETGEAFRIPLRHSLQAAMQPESVYAIAEDRYHTLWVGSNEGLFRLDPETLRVESYDAGGEGTLSHGYIQALLMDHHGTLWVGTHGGGLNRADVGLFGLPVQFKTYHSQHGIQGGALFGVVEDLAGILWLSGPQGLTRFDPALEQGTPVTQEGQPPETEYSRNAFYRLRSGELLFGGRNGFTLFHPENVVENRLSPGIAITDLQIGHKSVDVGQQVRGRTILRRTIEETEEVVLSHREQVLTFQFAALHFTNPENNQFAAMLEGLDTEWHLLGKRNDITYTTLPPGRYTLRVKAANSDGVWDATGIRLRLVVRPPFYRTLWFMSLSVLMVGGGIFGFARWRSRIHILREQKLQAMVDERTARLQEAMEELEQMAITDAMTGLANYRHFKTVCRKTWAQAARDKEPLALVMLDIDHFKRYNDAFGHQAGDDCLRQVAAAIQNCARRAGDVVARYGGEEFVILLQGTDEAGAEMMLEWLRKSIEDLALLHPDSPVSSLVTASLGGAVVVPSRESTLDDLIMRADQALYRAKAKGRNQACMG